VGDIRIPITVSIGVALLENTDTVDSFFERADHALYHAKDTGRNKVCCHQSHQASATNVKPTPGLLLSKAQ
jgi:PleD family two-component response regulator